MKITADNTWIITILLIKINVSRPSITGLTYHDDMDFEEKYRNIHECDPFYWHPLHLPEHCAEVFANAIRSRVAKAAGGPVRILTNRDKSDSFQSRSIERNKDIHPVSPDSEYFEPEFGQGYYNTEYYDDYHGNIDSAGDTELSPYEKMLDFLRKDANKYPTAPVIGMSNYGPIAMYEQPISKKSGKIIKKLVRAYARANKAQSRDDGYFYGKIEYPSLLNNNSNVQVLQSVEMLSKIIEKKKQGKGRKKSKKRKRPKGLVIE